MKIKGKGIVRTEQITCRVLLLISFITFVLCFVMEYLFPLWIGEYYCDFLHLTFLKNVTLGISGSAFVSFVCVIFPYLKKTHNFKKKFFYIFYKIGLNYKFFKISIETTKNTNEFFSSDICLKDNINNYLDEINKFISNYIVADFRTKEFDTFVVLLLENIIPNYQIVLCAIYSILKFEKAPNRIREENIIGLAKKEIYSFVLEKINENNEGCRLNDSFLHINCGYVKFVYKNFLRNKFSNVAIVLSKSRKKLRNKKYRPYENIKFYLQTRKKIMHKPTENDLLNDRYFKNITNEIERIIKRYERIYLKECGELKRMFNFLMNNKTIEVDRNIVDFYNKLLERETLSNVHKVFEGAKKVFVENGYPFVKSDSSDNIKDVQE